MLVYFPVVVGGRPAGRGAGGSVLTADLAQASGQVQLYPAAMSGIPLIAVSYCCDSVGEFTHRKKKIYIYISINKNPSVVMSIGLGRGNLLLPPGSGPRAVDAPFRGTATLCFLHS